MFHFHPYFGEDEPILTHIFQMGSETTNMDVSMGLNYPPHWNLT